MERCKYCGEPMTERTKFCPNCGKPREVIEEAEYVLEEEPETIPAAEDEPAEYVILEEEPSGKHDPLVEDVSCQSVPPKENTRQQASPQPAPSPEDASHMKPEPVQKKASKLSVWAFVCSLTLVLSWVGIILAIIDLVKGRSQPRKKGLSVAALVIGGIVMLLAFIGNNVDLETLMAPKEQPLAEIRGETMYAADGFTVSIGNHNWEGKKERRDRLLFYPTAEKGKEAGPSTSIEVDEYILPSTNTKTAEKFVEEDMKFYGDSPAKTKSLSVNGGYKGAWAEGKKDGRKTRIACWIVEDRLFTVAYYGVGLNSDGEAVYREILDSFVPTKPKMATDQAETATASSPADALSSRIISIACGRNYLVVLRENGTVAVKPHRSFSFDPDDFTDIAAWNDVIAIDASDYNTGYVLGLKSDGTVLISIPNASISGQFGSQDSADALIKELRGWKDVTSIEAGDYTVYGIANNGAVLTACFNSEKQERWHTGHIDTARKWSGVTQVKENDVTLYGRIKSGKWVRTKQSDYESEKEVEQRADVVDFGGSSGTVMLLSDGSLKLTRVDSNNQYYGALLQYVDSSYTGHPFTNLAEILSSWTDICEIYADDHRIIGLRRDGMVLSVYNPLDEFGNKFGQCDVSTWRNVIHIAGDFHNTYGLTKDGMVLYAGVYADEFDPNVWP